jgi:hypothetical protein
VSLTAGQRNPAVRAKARRRFARMASQRLPSLRLGRIDDRG